MIDETVSTVVGCHRSNNLSSMIRYLPPFSSAIGDSTVEVDSPTGAFSMIQGKCNISILELYTASYRYCTLSIFLLMAIRGQSFRGGKAARPAWICSRPFIVRIHPARALGNELPADLPAWRILVDSRNSLHDTNGCAECGEQERNGLHIGSLNWGFRVMATYPCWTCCFAPPEALAADCH